jgi:hypothetical protein
VLECEFGSGSRGDDSRKETEMDSSFTVRPRVGVQQFTSRDPRQAPETEPAAAKTVAPPGDNDGDAEQRDKRQEHAPPDVIADPEARDVIIRENDIRNKAGEHPDQALMRLRAYRPAPTGDVADPNDPASNHANIKA